MPFFELPNDESEGALYWEVFGGEETAQSIESLDRSKETVLFLPPLLGHIGFLKAQYEDENLRRRYNLLGVEPRHMGRSHARPLPQYDSVVAAADLAVFLDSLELPAVHLFSPQATSNPVALRLTCLFPERVLSLVMAGPNPVNERERDSDKADVYEAMVESWGSGQDPEAWAEATHELQVMVFSEHPPNKDEVDLWAHHQGVRIRYQPLDHFQFSINHLYRKSIPDHGLASITCPVLLISGTDDLYACEVEWYKEHLKGAEVSSFTVEGAPHGATAVAPDLVNRAFYKFLTTHSWPAEKALQPIKTDFAEALARLPLMTADAVHLEGRDPKSPLSFTVKSDEEVEASRAQLEALMAAEPPKPRVAWGFGGPIYNHDVSKMKYRFSERYDEDPWLGPEAQDEGRFGHEEWILGSERDETVP